MEYDFEEEKLVFLLIYWLLAFPIIVLVMIKAYVTGSIGAFASVPLLVGITFIAFLALSKKNIEYLKRSTISSWTRIAIFHAVLLIFSSLYILTDAEDRGPFRFTYSPNAVTTIVLAVSIFFWLAYLAMLALKVKNNVNASIEDELRLSRYKLSDIGMIKATTSEFVNDGKLVIFEDLSGAQYCAIEDIYIENKNDAENRIISWINAEQIELLKPINPVENTYLDEYTTDSSPNHYPVYVARVT